MDYNFSTEDEVFRSELHNFFQKELPNDWTGSLGDAESDWKFTLKMRQKMAQEGWLSMAWPKEYGGQEASIIKQVIFAEEVEYNRVPGRDAFGVRMLAPTLMIHGTEEQKREHLPKIARGEIQWCQGYSEPGSGSDLASLQTKAVEDGDDYVINGTKVWTSMAHRADQMFMMARTDPDAPKHRGISFFLLDMKAPGVEVQPIINMVGNHHFNMINFEDVRVPKKNLVGEVNRGWYVGATLLDFERSGIEYSASARRVIEELIQFSNETYRNGCLLSEDPIIRYRLAKLRTEIEMSRLNSYQIGYMQSQGIVPNKESSIGKVFGTELQQRISKVGMQILGMYGQLEPDSKYAPLRGEIEQSFMQNVSVTIAAGTSEIQRNIIATRGLGLPRG